MLTSEGIQLHAAGNDEAADDLFDSDEPIGVTKRELYKQTKEAKTMERLTRRMQGGALSYSPVSCCPTYVCMSGN